MVDEATLFNIAVDPDYIKSYGVRKKVLKELIQQLLERNIQTLWLEVRETNIKARQLYHNLGFNEVDIRKNYYPLPDGKRESAVVMALINYFK